MDGWLNSSKLYVHIETLISNLTTHHIDTDMHDLVTTTDDNEQALIPMHAEGQTAYECSNPQIDVTTASVN